MTVQKPGNQTAIQACDIALWQELTFQFLQTQRRRLLLVVAIHLQSTTQLSFSMELSILNTNKACSPSLHITPNRGGIGQASESISIGRASRFSRLYILCRRIASSNRALNLEASPATHRLRLRPSRNLANNTSCAVSTKDGFQCLKVLWLNSQYGGIIGKGIHFEAGAMPQLRRLRLELDAQQGARSKHDDFELGGYPASTFSRTGPCNH
jgi:hypothetical protein